MPRSGIVTILLVFLWNINYSQENFVLPSGVEKDRISFELVNNLIIIPVELNGLHLSFLLDTGVDTTVLFGINENDTLDISDAEKIRLRGIGGDEYIEALKSVGNQMKVGKSVSNDLTLYLILDRKINFSPRLGFPVHGIIGSDLFQDFIVEINYKRKFIRLYEKGVGLRKTERYEAIPLVFFKNKPYLNAEIELEARIIRGTFLIDSGLSDALWLFENEENISIPERSYEDLIGLGLVGDINGSRSRIDFLKIGDQKLREVNTSFPDTAAFGGLKFFIGRNGSIGAEVLRRFHMILDYQDRKMYLIKNSDFSDEFMTNRAGITVEHSGFIVLERYAKAPSFTEGKDVEGTEVISSRPKLTKTFSLKPEFRIARIRKDSPADLAGLQEGDMIVSLNNRKAYQLEMEKISSLFSAEAGKRIHMKIRRNGKELDFVFYLKNVL